MVTAGWAHTIILIIYLHPCMNTGPSARTRRTWSRPHFFSQSVVRAFISLFRFSLLGVRVVTWFCGEVLVLYGTNELMGGFIFYIFSETHLHLTPLVIVPE